MRKNILFIYPELWSFVACDKAILEEIHTVLPFSYRPSKSLIKNIFSQFRLLVFLMKNIRRADAVFIWFADYHSFLPILVFNTLSKKTYLALGGYDVTYIPKIKYGAFSNPLRSFCAGFSIKNANVLLPVDESLAVMAKKKLGKINGTSEVVYFGFDSKDWYCDTTKENMVLTVANIKDMQTYYRKGIDFYVEVARLLPQFKFIIIGLSPSLNIDNKPTNVELIPKMERPLLRGFYSRARVYAQFSIHEGLPNVLCEAMMCECVPVGTNICGIPTGIGQTGFIVNNVEEAQMAIIKAMDDKTKGKAARERILQYFNLSTRKEKLFELLG